jgi:hypothetical protein
LPGLGRGNPAPKELVTILWPCLPNLPQRPLQLSQLQLMFLLPRCAMLASFILLCERSSPPPSTCRSTLARFFILMWRVSFSTACDRIIALFNFLKNDNSLLFEFFFENLDPLLPPNLGKLVQSFLKDTMAVVCMTLHHLNAIQRSLWALSASTSLANSSWSLEPINGTFTKRVSGQVLVNVARWACLHARRCSGVSSLCLAHGQRSKVFPWSFKKGVNKNACH